jgi:hypothetical protein
VGPETEVYRGPHRHKEADDEEFDVTFLPLATGQLLTRKLFTSKADLHPCRATRCDHVFF